MALRHLALVAACALGCAACASIPYSNTATPPIRVETPASWRFPT